MGIFSLSLSRWISVSSCILIPFPTQIYLHNSNYLSYILLSLNSAQLLILKLLLLQKLKSVVDFITESLASSGTCHIFFKTFLVMWILIHLPVLPNWGPPSSVLSLLSNFTMSLRELDRSHHFPDQPRHRQLPWLRLLADTSVMSAL